MLKSEPNSSGLLRQRTVNKNRLYLYVCGDIMIERMGETAGIGKSI